MAFIIITLLLLYIFYKRQVYKNKLLKQELIHKIDLIQFQIEEMNKKELIEYCNQIGVKVNKSDTIQSLKDKAYDLIIKELDEVIK